MKKHLLFFKVISVLIATFFIFPHQAQAQKYSDYPVKEVFVGKIAKPKLSSKDGTLTFRTRIRDGIKQGVNYAGHYTVIPIGCGNLCIFAFVVNLKTGRIIDFPLGGEENYQMQLQYKAKSRLIKAIWHDIEANVAKACVIDFFEIDNDAFKKVGSNRKPVQDGYCNSYVD